MARPPVFPAEEKVRIVLSILAGEITVAEAARVSARNGAHGP
jgi:transposase